MNNLVKRASAQLWEDDYNRIISGKRLNLLNRPYPISYIDKMISYYEDNEEYEKCTEILKIREDLINHEKGYSNGQ